MSINKYLKTEHEITVYNKFCILIPIYQSKILYKKQVETLKTRFYYKKKNHKPNRRTELCSNRMDENNGFRTKYRIKMSKKYQQLETVVLVASDLKKANIINATDWNKKNLTLNRVFKKKKNARL